MALGQRGNAGPIVYVQFNAKDGKLYTRERSAPGAAVVKTAHDFIDGNVTGLAIFEDSYDGQPVYKLHVKLADSGVRYQVELNASTRQALELMGRLNAADLGHPVRIAGYSIEAGSEMPDGGTRETDLVGVGLRQGPDFGTKIDPHYSEELGRKQPKAIMLVDDNGNPVKIKGVEQMDKDASTLQRQQLVATLMDAINERLGHGAKQGQGDGDGIDADAAAAAAGQADRGAMRARG